MSDLNKSPQELQIEIEELREKISDLNKVVAHQDECYAGLERQLVTMTQERDRRVIQMRLTSTILLIFSCTTGNYESEEKNRTFIALANPATIIELCALLEKAKEALETCTEGDYSTGHVIHPSFDEASVNQALAAIKQWKEQK
jgi:FtsZ-binding cell division protein ZapB